MPHGIFRFECQQDRYLLHDVPRLPTPHRISASGSTFSHSTMNKSKAAPASDENKNPVVWDFSQLREDSDLDMTIPGVPTGAQDMKSDCAETETYGSKKNN